jgi:hypothetical protein
MPLMGLSARQLVAVGLAVTLGASACSPRRTAVRILGKALAGGTSTFASDDDPELVREALPFALKTIESLLASDPGNRDLALAACSGFAQYAYGFLVADAERLRGHDRAAAESTRKRALGLLLRGRDYCLSVWPVPNATEALRRDPIATAAQLGARDAALLYWTGAAWGGALSSGRDRPDLLGDLPAIRAIFDRLLVVEPGFDRGAAHEAMIALEALPAMMGGSLERADGHYQAALAASNNTRASPHVSWAESVAVARQDRPAFLAALDRALAIDPNADPSARLATRLAHDRARRLLARADDLFLEPLDEEPLDPSGEDAP